MKAMKDKKDRDLLMDLIKDRLENAHIQPSLGISYALDNVSDARARAWPDFAGKMKTMMIIMNKLIN